MIMKTYLTLLLLPLTVMPASEYSEICARASDLLGKIVCLQLFLELLEDSSTNMGSSLWVVQSGVELGRQIIRH